MVKNERADPVTMRPKGGARVAVRRPQETSVVDLPDQRRTANFIAAQLRQAIRDGLYGYGEQMPPERQLADAFGAARSTVRKALQQLEDGRLVVRRVGSGTFVDYAPEGEAADIADVTSPLELIEARFALEPHMTRLAAVHANRRDLERLAEALVRVEAAGDDAEQFTRSDQAFHQLLAQCTHNPLFVGLYRQINEVRGHSQWLGTKDKILTKENIARYNRQHRALYEALSARDVDGAVAVINAHLDKARRDLLGVSSG